MYMTSTRWRQVEDQMHNYKLKQIINGKTYNTETATLVYDTSDYIDGDDYGSLAMAALYQTRHGAFFLLVADHEGYPRLQPISDDEARTFLEKHQSLGLQSCPATQAIEQYFGPFPEGGAAETRLTIRIPGNLATRVEAAAKAKGISMNSYAMRCFERGVAADAKAQQPGDHGE
jgi:hypothetical protein